VLVPASKIFLAFPYKLSISLGYSFYKYFSRLLRILHGKGITLYGCPHKSLNHLTVFLYHILTGHDDRCVVVKDRIGLTQIDIIHLNAPDFCSNSIPALKYPCKVYLTAAAGLEEIGGPYGQDLHLCGI